jgi:hypothetical protein
VLAAVLPLARDAGHDGRRWRVLQLASLLGISVTGLVNAAVAIRDQGPDSRRRRASVFLATPGPASPRGGQGLTVQG